MKFTSDTKTLGTILLDPNNYRFLDHPSWKRRLENRFHEATVQDATLKLLESTAKYNLAELRQSILTNGYIALERIVVVPFEHAAGNFLTVEGNRRIAALKTILRDHNDGVLELSGDQLVEYSNVPIAVLDPEQAPLIAAHRIIMGIRHIAGPQEWGAYQQATLILQLVEEEGLSFEDISKHLNLSAIETRRRYRAIRALKAMEGDEMYSKISKPSQYSLFHEMVSNTSVREYFAWDNDNASFTIGDKAKVFYELIAPLETDNSPKLNTYLDVRSLRNIVGKPEAEASLLDPEQPLSLALTKAQPTPTHQTSVSLMNEAKTFNSCLSEAQIDTIAGLTVDEISYLSQITELIERRIEEYKKLRS